MVKMTICNWLRLKKLVISTNLFLQYNRQRGTPKQTYWPNDDVAASATGTERSIWPCGEDHAHTEQCSRTDDSFVPITGDAVAHPTARKTRPVPELQTGTQGE